jgi:hypothetical protein
MFHFAIFVLLRGISAVCHHQGNNLQMLLPIPLTIIPLPFPLFSCRKPRLSSWLRLAARRSYSSELSR